MANIRDFYWLIDKQNIYFYIYITFASSNARLKNVAFKRIYLKENSTEF